MGAKSAGARLFSFSARLVSVLTFLVVGVGACTGSETADAEPLPTSTALAETPTAVATPTSVPTPTPTPTAEPTATPIPTPTPTGTERYGELLVEGVYDWPTEMPDDLTDDEVFAINIFASMENAGWLAASKADMTIAELDLLRPYAGPTLFEFIEDSIALFEAEGEQLLLPPSDRRMEFVRIERTTSENATKAFIVCLHLDSESLITDSGETTTQSQTAEREVYFEPVGDVLALVGWRTISADYGVFTCDGS